VLGTASKFATQQQQKAQQSYLPGGFCALTARTIPELTCGLSRLQEFQ
jgi:hypothetical protein